MITIVDCSWPGSVHDAKVIANSSINLLFQEKSLPDLSWKLNDDDSIAVGPVLLGDPPYPLLPGLLTEFDACGSDEVVFYNIKLRSACNQIECAFGGLKARWTILNRLADIAIDHVPTLVLACFLLHQLL